MSVKFSSRSLLLAVWLLLISSVSLINFYQNDDVSKQTQANEKVLELAEARRISEIEHTVSQLPLSEVLTLKGEEQSIAIRYYLQQILFFLALLVVALGMAVYVFNPSRGRR